MYQARNSKTGVLAAVKAVRGDKLGYPKLVETMMSEIKILRTVVHPNIVKLLDHIERPVRPC